MKKVFGGNMFTFDKVWVLEKNIVLISVLEIAVFKIDSQPYILHPTFMFYFNSVYFI